MKSKWLASVLAVGVLSTALIGCSNSNNNGAKEPGATSTASPDAKLSIVNGKIEPPVTITTLAYENPAIKFRDGESATDNVFTRWAENTLGVKIKTLWSGGVTDGSFNTKLKLMLSSGDDLPDVVFLNDKASTDLLVDSGKYMKVEDLADKYASANYKRSLEEIKSDVDVGSSHNALWIRQDWLDKLKLKAPTTTEELEAVMDAFVNQDPDGNGKKDTYALDFSMKDKFSNALIGDISWVFGLYGAVPEKWYPGEDGKLQFGSVQPGIKQGLVKLSEWKDKGYIASDIALHDMAAVVTSVASDKVGMVSAPGYFPGYAIPMLRAKKPTAEYKPYPFPQGSNGPAMHSSFSTNARSTLIKKNISDEALQAYFHLQNTLFDVYDSNDPLHFSGFQEGYDYVVKDGKIVTDDKEIPGGKLYTYDYMSFGPPAINSKVRDINLKLANKEELTDNDRIVVVTLGINDGSAPFSDLGFEAFKIVNDQSSSFVKEYYKGPLTSTMSSRNELLQKMQMETFTKIIYGQSPADEFDKYVNKWKSSGGDTITKEVNEWYDSTK